MRASFGSILFGLRIGRMRQKWYIVVALFYYDFITCLDPSSPKYSTYLHSCQKLPGWLERRTRTSGTKRVYFPFLPLRFYLALKNPVLRRDNFTVNLLADSSCLLPRVIVVNSLQSGYFLSAHCPTASLKVLLDPVYTFIV